MSQSTVVAPQVGAATPPRSLRSIALSMEIDMRLLGLIGATAVIWIGFNILSGGSFLTARNLWNLSVQSASVAVMATGMVLIIVSRNIDLSVGSVLGFTGMLMALLQAEWLTNNLGLGLNHPLTWIIALTAGILVGAAIGGLQGVLVAYVGIPSFIVTLAGLLIWRGFAWTLASGRTIAPLDATFLLLGGGPRGSVGATISWIIGGLACIALIYALTSGRRRRHRYGFPVRPMWAEATIGLVGCAGALGAVWLANAYFWPEALAREYAAANGITWPEGGLQISTGIANPVLIAIGVAVVMTILATRRRFGRYVYAIGGNPDAAELGGINTRRIIMMTFILMGILAAISGAISSARLESAVVGLGVGAELAVISAAVIGGTSFAGGIGTIPGAVFGAVLMQSLQSGMALLKIDAPIQDIIVGIVLVTAVGLDTLLRRQDVRWSRFRPVLYVVTGLVNLVGAFFVVVGAGSSQLGSVSDAAEVVILVAGAATIVISIGTVLWPFVERSRPGSGQLIGVVGAVAAIALVLIVATLGNPAANPGFNLNMFISGLVALLYATIAFTSGSSAARVAAPNVTAAGDAR